MDRLQLLSGYHQIYLMCDCRGINPSEEEVQDIINSVDTDYSGKIEWPEFAAALAEKLKPHEDEEGSGPTRSRHHRNNHL